eukprot:11044623-Ditylum_brightwellii.AAC.1
MGALEEVLVDNLIVVLFEGLPEVSRDMLAHSVKNSGLAISNPVEIAEDNYATLVDCNGELVEVLLDHKNKDDKGCQAGQSDAGEDGHIIKTRKHTLMRLMEMGAWLTVVLDRMNRTELGKEEFCDNLHLRYGQWLLYL